MKLADNNSFELIFAFNQLSFGFIGFDRIIDI